MSRGIAQKRAAKAQRRKTLLKERRKQQTAEGRSSKSGQVRRLAAAPLHACLLQKGLFERGNGMVILARRAATGRVAVSGFLLDVFCLGVKDAFVREFEASEVESFIGAIGADAPLEPVEPPYARKLLRDLVAYARELGFPPHADYAAAEQLFGEVAAEACDENFAFGRDGKPFYIPGPRETPMQIRQRLTQLLRRLGEEGFDYMLEVDQLDDAVESDFESEESDFEDEESDFEDARLSEGAFVYDPEVAPEPTAWLALDEEERTRAVRAYCRRAGLRMPSPRAHAAIVAVVETQAALGDELPVERAITRLRGEGLDRHQAVLAVGSVLAMQIHRAIQNEGSAAAATRAAYDAAIDALTAEQWLALAEGDGEDKK